MTYSEDRAARVLVYGSCVARDTIEFAPRDSVDLRGYIARQSLLSAGSDASSHLPVDLGIASKFQERMIRADFAGTLHDRLDQHADDIDVLLWDLADERHGVHRFADGTFVTRSIDTIRAERVAQLLDEAEHLPFGSDEHFELWSERARQMHAMLSERGLLERTAVLQVPWAIRTTEGKPTPWSMGVRAADANERYLRYYDALRQQGFPMVELSVNDVLADPSHRWGLAPFHYMPAVYGEVLRQLHEEHGVEALHDPEG
ncbi:DUF6270 domain-containing protein [Agrococcus sp. 1P02AA]|uniref:DUF6270 domain-containing protein n=1 Tax=Agrococcus sp. 1P02AA TaxID=3132259 RepID=UPI0039A50DB3